ncbi:MAG TPA: AMP-binding protein [Lacunisphaera sp.]|jgi:amino acid adenylation domain-containing protein
MGCPVYTACHHALLVRDFLEQSADRLPEKIALVCDGKRLTYREVDTLADRVAHALIDLGVKRGDRVAIFLQNSVETVAGIFGIMKAGATFVVVNPTTKREKLLYILANCRATALIADARSDLTGLIGIAEPVVPSLRGCILGGSTSSAPAEGAVHCISFQTVVEKYPAQRPARANIDLDLACLIYTSGTTGDPKGVMSDHSNVAFAAASIIEYLNNNESDVVINVLPLSFDYGLYQLLMTFKFGGTLVLERSFAYPAAILKRIEQERVTGFPGVPTLYALLLPMDLSAFDLSSLRYLTNTAAALPVSHIEALRKKFPHVTMFSMYGLTETKRTLYLPPEELDRRPGSVGRPIPGTEAWIEDDAGRRLGPGEVGELVVRGRHVMRGYWEAAEMTAKRYRTDPVTGDRLCYTNDLFRTDEDGFFYFVSRKDDIIKSRGEKVAPKEVESIIHGIASVSEVAVIGVADPVLGQAIKAFVVTTDSTLTEKAILAHCRARMEDYMVPKVIEFRVELPKSSNGKIRKSELS